MQAAQSQAELEDLYRPYREKKRTRGSQAKARGLLEVRPGKAFQASGLYGQYAGHQERLAAIPSHRYLAIRRGMREEQLRCSISLNTEPTLAAIGRVQTSYRHFAVEL